MRWQAASVRLDRLAANLAKSHRSPPAAQSRSVSISPRCDTVAEIFGTRSRGREAMAQSKTIDPHRVAQIVGRYVAHNTVAASDLPNVIAIIYRSLTALGAPAEVPMPTKPAVTINRSYGRDFVICLDCGWRGKMLRRHLTASHSLSPAEYRARWGLKITHPLTSPGYSERRSLLAKQVGLGRGRRASALPPEAAAPPPKRRGRSRRATPPPTTP